MPMTSDAKDLLRKTIRGLRDRLLTDLHASTESAYRLAIRSQDADLDEASRARRRRLEAWISEQLRAQRNAPAKLSRSAEDFRLEVEKQAAYTLLNRLIFLRLLEASNLRSVSVVKGGWESHAYKDFRQLAPDLIRGDRSEGYEYLLELIFEDLATELPGLYGPVGLADLVPLPPATLRHVVQALNQDGLESCWTDDMTLGWVYQYWNDPERENLDAKLNGGARLASHELASKTQMFTERYMVDWLLQNSLGPLWLAICQKNGWTAEVERDGVLAALEERRQRWRADREAGRVDPRALMPLHTLLEERWASYVAQPLPKDAVERAPESVREIKLLDPAVGSGHFLMVAFDLLFALYQEEARQRGEVDHARWSPQAIAESILEHNLHGIDLDPRAVQIAAAALWLKAKQACQTVRPRKLNLVASNLQLTGLPEQDPALQELFGGLEQEVQIPRKWSKQILEALKGADHLGSLLKFDATLVKALGREGEEQLVTPESTQLSLLAQPVRVAGLLERLETFLKHHARADDLGLRLRGEQLATGVRFVRMLREGQYHLVVGNPPYQGTSKIADASYVTKNYPKGKADLYAAFLERGLELVKEGGTSALLTMRNWMFIKQYAELRQWLVQSFDLRALGDFAIGAFDEVPNDVLSVVVSVFRRTPPQSDSSVALQPTPPDDRSYDRERTRRKRAAVSCQVGRYEFEPKKLAVVPEWPLVYWWGEEVFTTYSSFPKVVERCPARQGLTTGNNDRFLRTVWEISLRSLVVASTSIGSEPYQTTWVPLIKGAAGIRWIEPASIVVDYTLSGLQMALGETKGKPSAQFRNETFYFRKGVAFTTTGADFGGRAYRMASIFENKGRSIFPDELSSIVCFLNSALARRIAESLNPTIDFTVGDVNRLPLFPIANSDKIFATVEKAFSVHEAHREPSVEFQRPGPSPWRYAQAWAQEAVDRPEGAPLPEYREQLDAEPPTDHLSFAVGVALGRFYPEGGIVGGEGHGGGPPNPRPLSPARGARGEEHSGPHSEPLPLPSVSSGDSSFSPPPSEPLAPLAGERGLGLGGQVLEPLAGERGLGLGGQVLEPLAGERGWGLGGQVLEPLAGERGWGLGGQVLEPLAGENGLGLGGPAPSQPFTPLPGGILFLDGTLAEADRRDSLGHPACAPLLEAWTRHGPSIEPGGELRTWLRQNFFKDVHRGMYENRPIHWPLSSTSRTFVAWITIHRWNEQTLRLLLADHLLPTLTRLEGELADLRVARDGDDARASKTAEKRYDRVLKQREELQRFVADVQQCADKGPLPADPSPKKCPPREVDTRYAPDLDDGVMINSAALWPVLEPQWKDPRKWWTELASAQGRKDYDWSHLAMRYWPDRVDKKCRQDPSLGVAHGCFWKYHPARAWAWELRLQQEIGPTFRIEEASYRSDGGDAAHRAAWLFDHPQEALDAIEAEALRRRRKDKTPQPELRIQESGLWSAHPEACWQLELRMIEKQGLDFCLRSPDEPEARAAFAQAHPALVRAREDHVRTLFTISIPDGVDEELPEADDDERGEEEA